MMGYFEATFKQDWMAEFSAELFVGKVLKASGRAQSFSQIWGQLLFIDAVAAF